MHTETYFGTSGRYILKVYIVGTGEYQPGNKSLNKPLEKVRCFLFEEGCLLLLDQMYLHALQ